MKNLVLEGREKGFVGEKDAGNAMPEKPTPARLYGNPKTHKQIQPGNVIPPLREIVAGSGSNCEGLGKIIDSITRPVDEMADTFIMDTPHLLRKIEELNAVGGQPVGTHLFTCDVVALYPSVPTSRAPEVLRRRLLAAGLKQELVDWVVRSTLVLLKSNTFEYDSGEGPKLYTQADGAGIGQANACAYAGIFMAEVEETALFNWGRRGGGRMRKGLEWRQGNRAELGAFWRFRDDCLGLFRGTKADFLTLLAALNGVDPAIRFTEEGFGHAVNFLDVRITLGEDGKLHTTLYVKPNTKNQLLLPSSSHPPFVTRSSAYSLFLRLRRICSDEASFLEEADKLQERLEVRQYPRNIVEAARLRAAAIPRTRALAKVARRETNGERQHRLVCQYDRRSGPALRGVMEDSYEAASTRDVRFRRWFPNKPRPAFRRGKTLREELVKARLPSGRVVRPRAAARERWEGVRRCSKGQNAVRCQCCSILTETPASVVRSVVVNGREVKVEDAITCKTESVIYVIMSRKDPTRCYGGQTGGRVDRRLGQHRRDIMNRDESKVVARHFMQTNSTVDDIIFVPIKIVRRKNLWARLEIERKFLNDNNLLDDGININL